VAIGQKGDNQTFNKLFLTDDLCVQPIFE